MAVYVIEADVASVSTWPGTLSINGGVGSAPVVSETTNFSGATAATIGATVSVVTTLGRLASGDGGGASYVRWVAGMTALVLNQQGYSWFASADGAQWTLSEAVIRPEMFGAIGHATNDEGLAIRRMFEAASGKEVLITKTHRYKSLNNAEDIRVYSNTKVQGISALTCGFKRIPNELTEQLTTPSYGVYWQDASDIEINDIFHDAQRSGLGRPSESNQRVNGFLPRGQNGRWRVNRCIVHNATGYAFYPAAVGAGKSVDGIFTDCIAYNSQVSFETTGLGTKVQFIRCHSRQLVIDAGAPVLYECGFHQYGGVAGAHHYQCTHEGVPAAVLTVIVEDGVAHSGVVYEDCNFENNNASIACAIVRNDFFSTVAHPGNGKRAQATFIGGRVANLIGPATSFIGADVSVNGTKFVGETVAFAVGQNTLVALRGNFDIQCIEPVTTSSGAASIAVDIDPTAVATRTASGKITATHLNGGPKVAVSGTLTSVSDTVFSPVLGGGPVGSEAPRIIQRKRGFKIQGGDGATNIIKPTAANEYWALVSLDAVPAGWGGADASTDFNKVRVSTFWSEPANNAITFPVISSIKTYRKLDNGIGAVFFTISTTTALPANARLHYDIWEEV